MKRRDMKNWSYYLRVCTAHQRVLWFSLVLALSIFIPLALAFHRPSEKVERAGVRFLTHKGTDDAQSACEYYKAIGAMVRGECNPNVLLQPNGKNFREWKLENGFLLNADANRNRNPFDDDSITGEVSALYTNLADLNLGRSMHAKKVGENVAFWVCNFLTVREARSGENVQACVAMDNKAVPGINNNQPFTKFYVFFPPPGGGPFQLSLAVDLDKRGKKFVPGLCVACHGGDNYSGKFGVNPTPSPNPDIGSYYLPFDLDNFAYLNTEPFFSRENQEDKFRQLNQLIKETHPTAAIEELINGWYPDPGRVEQNSGFVPPGWQLSDPLFTTEEQEDLYLKVVKPSCRTCHVAMRASFSFDRFDAFKGLSATTNSRVCSQYNMPNAVETFDQFWRSQDSKDSQAVPHQPEILQQFLQKALGPSVTVTCPEP